MKKNKRSSQLALQIKPATVCLVSMPFKDLRHPPIQLGILESCLRRADISVRTHSFELAFMEFLHEQTIGHIEDEPITIEDYLHVACEDFQVNLGDWIFKVKPYYESVTGDEEYLAFIRDFGISEDAISIAIRMRNLAPAFLSKVAEELLASRPRVVGFSSVFQQNLASLVLAKMLKERDPSVTIVFGGGNCDGPMGAALHSCFPWVDVVVRGEGERSLIEVVTDIINNRPVRPQPGLCFRLDGRQVVVPQADGPQVPMDEVPAPVYDEFFMRLDRSPLKYELRSEVAILFESSRGCWWGAKNHCTFCGLNGTLMKFRSKSAERVVSEILEFAEKYKILDFVAVDDIIDLAHIRDLMPLLQASGCDLQIFYETKANLKKEQLRLLFAGGVNAIQPGIESLSTSILQLMKKGVTALQNIRLLKWCTELGITPAWNILYGFPNESPAEYERMTALLPLLVHFEPPNIMPVQLERFSPFFERPAEYGMQITGPLPQYKFLYPVSPDELANIAYDFDHQYADGRDPETYVEKLKKAVQHWRRIKKEERGYLHYRRGPDFLIVEDRRAGIEMADYQFDGIEAKIYLACDEGVTVEMLRAQIANTGEDNLDADEIEEYLNNLVDAGIMLREGNRFLSLAIDSNMAGSRIARKTISSETLLTAI